jgi:photosystem II stability/assembly factor-like uncharacterized protein
MKGSPVDPGRIYASQTSGWFGQVVQRSDDGGKTWTLPGTPDGNLPMSPEGFPMGESNKFMYDTSPETGKPLTTHQHFDGTQKPWVFRRVWHIEPSLSEPDTVYAGVEDAALFKSTNGGQTWQEQAGLRGAKGEKWSPGAGGMCLHTLLLDPSDPQRIFIAISAAGAFRTDNSGDSWQEVKGDLPTDFGFPIDVHAHEPNTVFIIPMDPNLRVPPEGKLRVYRSKSGGGDWEPLGNGLPQVNCYVNVLREAMAVDSLDQCGIYFGTTGGQVYCSPDGGDTWTAAARDLPAVLSVEVQTLP